jgi:integrase/recombinase XerD
VRHGKWAWLKKQCVDDALIQPFSWYAGRQSSEIYSRLAIADVQAAYADAMGHFRSLLTWLLGDSMSP